MESRKAFLFNPGDVISIKINNINYVVILSSIQKEKKLFFYQFIVLVNCFQESPSTLDVENSELIGSIIATGYDEEEIKRNQPFIESLWHLFPHSVPFVAGLLKLALEEQELLPVKEKLQLVDNIKINSASTKFGGLRVEKDFDSFCKIISSPDVLFKTFGHKKFPLKMVLD